MVAREHRPGRALQDGLCARGDRHRGEILTQSLIERFVRGADGELVLATKGWTRAIHCIGQWRSFAGRRKAHVSEARAYQIVRQVKRLRGFKSAFGTFVAIPASTQKLPAVCLPANQLFDLSWTHIEL
jgi:hypothetical protein